ncbi:hypothetical protein INR49_014637, partial [Caranx melampygus]
MRNLRSLTVSLPYLYEERFSEVHQVENLTVYFSTDVRFKSPLQSDQKLFYNLNNLKVFTLICQGYHYGIPLNVPLGMLQAMKHLEVFTVVNIYTAAPDPNTFQYNHQLKKLTIRETDLSDLIPELFLPIPNLQVLELSYGNVQSLDFLAQANLSALRHLSLTSNKLTVINHTVFQFLPALTYLDLEGNPFTCDCSNVGFIQWVRSNKQTQVVNTPQYMCSFPVAEQGSKLLDFDIQSCWIDFSFLYFITSTCLVLLTLLSSFIYHFLRWQIAYAFHLFQAFLCDTKKKRKGAPYHYDAFISYNVHDEDWVYREMLPLLEGEQGWRLCLHHRDFQPGKPIIENITDAIYSSRKTICVISHHYLQSEWCSREIQMASFRLFDEQKDVLILLFLEEIPTWQLSPYHRMRKLVKKRTYLSWPKAGQHTGVFWQNVDQVFVSGGSGDDIVSGSDYILESMVGLSYRRSLNVLSETSPPPAQLRGNFTSTASPPDAVITSNRLPTSPSSPPSPNELGSIAIATGCHGRRDTASTRQHPPRSCCRKAEREAEREGAAQAEQQRKTCLSHQNKTNRIKIKAENPTRTGLWILDSGFFSLTVLGCVGVQAVTPATKTETTAAASTTTKTAA